MPSPSPAPFLLQNSPNHPGIAHYLIHCYDNSALAAQGLEAARTYAKIADSAHAQHMPSHIFVLLGLWQETVESNIASVDAAEKDAAASECQRPGRRNFKISPSGSAFTLFRATPPPSTQSPNTGAMLLSGQKRSRGKCGLSCRFTLWVKF